MDSVRGVEPTSRFLLAVPLPRHQSNAARVTCWNLRRASRVRHRRVRGNGSVYKACAVVCRAQEAE